MTSRSGTSQFMVEASDGLARAGSLRLPHGTIRTPAFMPVGTQAAVKALDPVDIRSTGSDIVLANTYHLMLRPGGAAIAELGGVGNFMGWNGPILTDSGGFQVFSLARNRTLSNTGVTFRSHVDGSTHTLSPESVIDLQNQFDSDISMALDVLAGYGADAVEQDDAMRLTHAWLPRNVAAFRSSNSNPARLLFGICQGGFDTARRMFSANVIASSDVDGCAIGGLSVGEPKGVMDEMLRASIGELPSDRPRYLMGVGSPEDLWNGVSAGVDMFDCVLPTRVARRGAMYTPDGRVNIGASRYRKLAEPIDRDCDCTTCAGFSAAYVHHLFRTRELLAYRLATIHNLRFIQRQMERMRTAIRSGSFERELSSFLERYRPADQVRAATQREKYKRSRERL